MVRCTSILMLTRQRVLSFDCCFCQCFNIGGPFDYLVYNLILFSLSIHVDMLNICNNETQTSRIIRFIIQFEFTNNFISRRTTKTKSLVAIAYRGNHKINELHRKLNDTLCNVVMRFLLQLVNEYDMYN